MKKTLVLLSISLMLCLISTSAMAIKITNRSAEMTENSLCDRAGTITMEIENQDEWTKINNEITRVNGPGYALIRISLSATDSPNNIQMPYICKSITGSDYISVLPAISGSGSNPFSQYVLLDDVDEISHISNRPGSIQDMDVYVRSPEGSGQRVIFVYITRLEPINNIIWTTADKPWFKIGLAGGDDRDVTTPNVVDKVDISTAICANVKDFSGIMKLTISNESVPQGLTFTGDNQIGHFGAGVSTRSCKKTESCGAVALADAEIPVQVVQTSSGQATCGSYYACFVAEGNFPQNATIDLMIKTYGHDSSKYVQDGVYFHSINVTNGNNGSVPVGWSWYKSWASDTEYAVGKTGCVYEARVARGSMQSSALGGTNKLYFCINYTIDPNKLTSDLGKYAGFNATASVAPCESVFNYVAEGGKLVKYAGPSACMYFPYVISQTGNWWTGVVVTNLTSTVSKSEMEAVFTLVDQSGTVFTYTKKDFESVVWAANLDDMISKFSGKPAAGPAILKINTNFSCDGYSFLSDGTWGAGSLPRIGCGNAANPIITW